MSKRSMCEAKAIVTVATLTFNVELSRLTAKTNDLFTK